LTSQSKKTSLTGVTIMVRLVPPELWQRFKAQAALEGVTLRSLFVDALQLRLKKATK